jgi:GTP-binding protein EngB required for normal cell division
MTISPTSPMKAIDLNTFATHMAEVEAFSEKRLGLPPDETFLAQIQTTRLGLFRLVVMGEIKKGKSSFINSLCGIPNLVPELSDVATSTIYKIRFGTEQKYTVFFAKETPDEELRKKEISHDQVGDYGTEAGNPNNAKSVDFIGIEAASPALSNGLVIVDTPGVGGLFKNHREITWRNAPHSDAIFFITDSIESPIGADEVLFLKELQRVTDLIYFVQTKTDKVDESAVKSRMENNIDILVNQAGFLKEKIFYFAVSSKLKKEADVSKDLEDLQDSGFIPLMQFLNQSLKAAKNVNIAIASANRSQTKIEAFVSQVEQKQAILEADTDEKRSAFQADNQKLSDAIERWSLKGKPDLDRQLRRELQQIMDEIGKHFRSQKASWATKIQEYLSTVSDSKVALESIQHFANDIRSDISALLMEDTSTLNRSVSSMIEGASVKMGVQISSELNQKALSTFVLDTTTTDTLEELARKKAGSKGDELLRAGFGGATMYASIGSVIGALVGSVVPVIGTSIGGYAGMALGALWGGYRGVDDRVSAKTLVEVEKVLNNFLNRQYEAVDTGLRGVYLKVSDQVSEAISDIILQSTKKLAEQKKQIEARARTDSATLKKESDALALMKADLSALKVKNAQLRELLAA